MKKKNIRITRYKKKKYQLINEQKKNHRPINVKGYQKTVT